MITTLHFLVPGTCCIKSEGGLHLSKEGFLKAIHAGGELKKINLTSVYSCALPCCVETTKEVLKQQACGNEIKTTFLPDLIDTRREDWGVLQRRTAVLLGELRKQKGQTVLVVATQRIIESFIGHHFETGGENVKKFFPVRAGVPLCQTFYTPY